jgi:hypothetical protein
MASPLIIENIEMLTKVTLGGTVAVGDTIAFDGTDAYVKADASDATVNLYTQFIALDKGVDGDEINACKKCTIYDPDAPYTADKIYFQSATAGAMTSTRPTTAGDVIQALGRSVDTYRVQLDIKAPYEKEVFINPDVYDTTDEPGLGVIDSPAWVGRAIDTDATAESVYFTGRIPSNAISLDNAKVLWNSIGGSTGTIGYTIICAADGATNTGDTGTTIAAATPTSIADNKICYGTITTAFDADALKAGYNFTVKCTAGGTMASDLQCLGLYMRWICV